MLLWVIPVPAVCHSREGGNLSGDGNDITFTEFNSWTNVNNTTKLIIK